jgi:hypothetical protein
MNRGGGDRAPPASDAEASEAGWAQPVGICPLVLGVTVEQPGLFAAELPAAFRWLR